MNPRALCWGVVAVCGWLSAPAAAQVYRCVQADGRVAFQDAPCAGGTGQQMPTRSPNAVGPAADRPEHIRAGIAARRPVPGMTEPELTRALGAPLRRTSTLAGATVVEVLTFRAEHAFYGVTLTNGVVTSVSETAAPAPPPAGQGAPGYAAPGRSCPTPRDIRNLEVEISKIENRDKPRVLAELHRQLARARDCR